MVRIAHLADTHLGYKQYNLEERERDIYDVLEEIGDKILEEHADIVIHSGDLFDSSRPTTQAYYAFKKFLKRLDGKAEFFAVLGDHDKPKIRSMPPHKLFDDQIQTLGISGNAQHQRLDVKGENVVVAGISNLSRNYRPLLVEELKKLETVGKDCDCSILVLHEGIDKFFIEEACELSLSELPKNFRYFAMGHLHTRIKASHGQGQLAYPGSSEIMNSEEIANWQKSGKGFNIVDVTADDIKITDVNLESIRPQIEVKLNFAHFADELDAFVKSLGSNGKLPVIHVLVEGKNVDRQGVLEALNEVLAGKVLTFRHKVNDVSQLRLPELKPGVFNMNQVLGDYLKDRKVAELASEMFAHLRQGDQTGAKAVANEYFEKLSKGVKAHDTEQSQAE
jgi:DNA repair exonuclease SbcCD nuclease subunit